jgi:uncharacterized membrane protein YuzA (DUF378 family)
MANDINPPARKAASTIGWIAFALLVIGGLNWGLIGLFDFDLVAALFGEMSPLSRAIYTLVGISAVYCAFAMPALRRRDAATHQGDARRIA